MELYAVLADTAARLPISASRMPEEDVVPGVHALWGMVAAQELVAIL